MPWMMPVAVGGAALLGNVMSQQGQQATNAQSWAAQLQSENWQEYMSDTQMQRRVEDLKRAGLNPMLAAGGPGAAMGSPVMPSLQNPSASFGNLGGQVANAMQVASVSSQIKQNEADAAKKNADAQVALAGLPYTGATAQAALDNLRKTNDSLTYQAYSLERDFNLSQRSLSQLKEDPTFQARLQEVKLAAQQVDLQRQQLGLPRLQNDAMWQKEHPEISGWMQSGVPAGILDTVGTASKLVNPLKFIGR